MIEVKNLTKLYGKFKAVDDVSLCAADGEVTILLHIGKHHPQP